MKSNRGWLALEWSILVLVAPFLLFLALKPEAIPLVLLVMVAVGILVTPSPQLTLPKATGLVLGVGPFHWVAGGAR